jgi:hypothetical protein
LKKKWNFSNPQNKPFYSHKRSLSPNASPTRLGTILAFSYCGTSENCCSPSPLRGEGWDEGEKTYFITWSLCRFWIFIQNDIGIIPTTYKIYRWSARSFPIRDKGFGEFSEVTLSRSQAKFASEKGKMNLMKKVKSQKGQTNVGYVLVGVVITVCVLFAIKYYQDRNHDVTIHVPQIEVH